MTIVYHDEDANPAAIHGQSVAILGYGNQGGAQARNLRDSGVEAGYPPEAILMELLLSGEMAYSMLKNREIGSLAQHELHSHTSQYGTLSRMPRYNDVKPLLQDHMRTTVQEIESGAFAKEWSEGREEKLAALERVREIRKEHPMTKWEESTRKMFRIGDAAQTKG